MIPKIQKVLYATDLSKNSAYAFRYAVNSARKHDASIHILHVVDSRPLAESYLLLHTSPARIAEMRKETQEDTSAKIEARLQEFARRELNDDPETLKRVASIQVVFGDPAEEILKIASTMKCDLVVMGTHGKGVISHAFLGSVAEKVLHRIEIPVYIIPIPKEDTDITLGEI
jgi:nucleotide-binding universal stress UspA family protein